MRGDDQVRDLLLDRLDHRRVFAGLSSLRYIWFTLPVTLSSSCSVGSGTTIRRVCRLR